MLDVLWRQSILHAAEITIDQIKGRGNIMVDIVLENSIMGAREGRNGNWVFLAEASEWIVMHWKEERIEGETLYRMISGQFVLSTLISGHIFHHLLSLRGNFCCRWVDPRECASPKTSQAAEAGWRKLLSRCWTTTLTAQQSLTRLSPVKSSQHCWLHIRNPFSASLPL